MKKVNYGIVNEPKRIPCYISTMDTKKIVTFLTAEFKLQSDASKAFGVSRGAMNQWISSGVIPPARCQFVCLLIYLKENHPAIFTEYRAKMVANSPVKKSRARRSAQADEHHQ
jgi:hypothetical protein